MIFADQEFDSFRGRVLGNAARGSYLKCVEKLPYYHMAGLLQATEVEGWPMYDHQIDALGLRPYIDHEIGIAGVDPLYGMYYLYLTELE